MSGTSGIDGRKQIVFEKVEQKFKRKSESI